MTVNLSHRLLSNKLVCYLMRNVPLFSSKRLLSFDLTEQQKKLKNKAKQFSKQTILPKAVEYDTKVEFPSKIIKQVHSRGLMNSLVPVEYGGLGYDLLSRVLISEVLAYGCTGVGVTMLGNDLAATPLLLGGREDQKKKYLGQLTSEPVLASYCVSKPNGSNGNELDLSAVHKGNE
uniref:Acyl-CoA dehydrogenase/oxidase N-terminal domain-containing protein n=1 Tax=Meloidogyne javanica TaxID=6303 RepID=A0A915LKU8_MELJA